MKDTDVIYKVVVVITSHILYIYIYILGKNFERPFDFNFDKNRVWVFKAAG